VSCVAYELYANETVKNGGEAIFKWTIADNFSELIKDTNVQIQNAQHTVNKVF
jgi:hypothetical protein